MPHNPHTPGNPAPPVTPRRPQHPPSFLRRNWFKIVLVLVAVVATGYLMRPGSWIAEKMGGTTVTSAQERQIALEKYYENKIEDLKNQVATAPDAKALEAAAKQLAETEAKLRDHKLETATQQEEAKKAREALAAAEVKIKDAEAKVEAAAKAKEVELAEAKAKEVEAAAVEIEEEEDNSPRFNPTETVDVPVIVDTEERVVPGGTIFILKKEGGRILSVDAKHKGRLEQVIFKCSRPSGELLILDPLPEKMRMLPGRLPVVIVQKKAK